MTLEQLQQELATAKEGSRRLDALIWIALDMRPSWVGDGELVARDDGHIALANCGAGFRSTCVTSIVDDAIDAIEAALPPAPGFSADAPTSSGWKIGIYRGMTPTDAPHACWEAMIRPHGSQWGYDHSAPTPALALMRALLRARISLASPVPSLPQHSGECAQPT